MDQETKRYFDRINEKLTLLVEAQKKETWVNGSWVMEITGWSKERMRSARMQGIIRYKKSNLKTYKYLLESIPQQFIHTNENITYSNHPLSLQLHKADS